MEMLERGGAAHAEAPARSARWLGSNQTALRCRGGGGISGEFGKEEYYIVCNVPRLSPTAKLESTIAVTARSVSVPLTYPHTTSRPNMADDERVCDICMSAPRAVRFHPCGHSVACELCTLQLIAKCPGSAKAGSLF